MHILHLQPNLLDQLVEHLDTTDLKSLVLTCRSLCYVLRHHLWSHVHVKTIDSRSNYTNTELRPYRGDHYTYCGDRDSSEMFMFEHECKQRYIRIDEHNLSEICIGMLDNGYEDAFSRVQTITFDIPMMFPECPNLPITHKEMHRVDFGSLVNWFVANLDPEIFIDLQRLEVIAVELMVELETPLVQTLLTKFGQFNIDMAVFAVLQENWVVRRPLPRLYVDKVKVLSIECGTLDDAYALTDGPLPNGIERIEIRVESGSCDADQLLQFLGKSRSVRRFTLNGDVINPHGIKWAPLTITQLNVQEHRLRLLPMRDVLYIPSVTHLRVGIKSGSIFEQIQLPYLTSLWVTMDFQTFTQQQYETLSGMLKASSRLVSLRTQGIPYDQVARLISFSGCDQIETLVLEYAGFTRGNEQFTNRTIRKGACKIVRECHKLKTLVIDLLLPKSKRVVEVLAEFARYCPLLETVVACVRDDSSQSAPWFSPVTTKLWTLSTNEQIDLGGKTWHLLDLPMFREQFVAEEADEPNIAADQNLTAALMYLSVN